MLLKVDSIEFIVNDATSYKINKNQIETFPLIGGTRANVITSQVFNQHGNTFIESYMEAQDEELTFIIFKREKTIYDIEAERKKLASICNPLNGNIQMKVTLNTGSVYNRMVTFAAAPTFAVGLENRNQNFQKVLLQYTANNPFWYSEEEIIESFQAVTPLFIFPFTTTGEELFRTDFTDKVYGSQLENPNLFQYKQTATLGTPADFTVNSTQTHIDAVKTLGGTISTYSTATAGNIPAMLFSFDLISLLERRYGTEVWGTATTLAEKVAIAESRISKMTLTHYGYGTNPTGNKIYLSIWNSISSTWYTPKTHTAAIVTPLVQQISSIASFVNDSGFVQCVIYNDAATATAASTINNDYINLAITFKNISDPVLFGDIQPNNIAVNEGHVPAPVLITINGACTNPRIDNISTGEYIQFNGLTMGADDRLEINTAFGEKSVHLNGTINVFNKLDWNSTFFSLQVGENEIKFWDDTGNPTAAIHFSYKNLFLTI